MDRFRIIYNPYFQTAEFAYRTTDGNYHKLSDSADDKLERFKTGFVLQNQTSSLLDVLTQMGGNDVNIFFGGTDQDYSFFEQRIQEYNSDRGTDILLRRDTSISIPSPEDITQEIKVVVEDLVAKGYAVDPLLKTKFDLIMNPEIPVIVTGNYSSGKSTLINALIGAEILPASANRETAVTCKIIQSESAFDVSFHDVNGSLFKINCVNPNESLVHESNPHIDELLLEMGKIDDPYHRTAAVLRKLNSSKDFLQRNSGLILHIPFIKSALSKNIVLIDTPGNDSVSNQDDLETINAALCDQIKGFIAYVCKADSVDSIAANDYVKTIVQNTCGKLDVNNTLYICNKCDSIEDIPSESAIMAQHENRFIFVSARAGLGSKLTDGKRSTRSIKSKYGSFFPPIDDEYLCLPHSARLPNERKTEICLRQQAAEDALLLSLDDPSLEMELLTHNSGIRAVEYELNYLAHNLFPINQCRRAKETLEEILRDLDKRLASEKENKAGKKEEQQAQFRTIYKGFVQQIEAVGKEECKRINENFPDEFYRNECDMEYRSNPSSFLSAVKKIIQEKANYMEKDNPYERDQKKKTLFSSLEGALKESLGKIAESAAEFSGQYAKDLCDQYSRECMQITNRQNFSTEEYRIFETFFKRDFATEYRVQFDPKTLPEINPIMERHGFMKLLIWVDDIRRNKQKERLENQLREQFKQCYDDVFDTCSKNCKRKLLEIFDKINSSFSAIPNNDGICSIHPQLNKVKQEIDDIEAEIRVIEGKKIDIQTKQDVIVRLENKIHMR